MGQISKETQKITGFVHSNIQAVVDTSKGIPEDIAALEQTVIKLQNQLLGELDDHTRKLLETTTIATALSLEILKNNLSQYLPKPLPPVN